MMRSNAPKLDEQGRKANKEKNEHAIRAMEKRIKKNPDGTLTLDARSADELGVDSEAFENLKQSLEETNKKIKSGEIPADQVGTSFDEPLR